MNTIHDPDMNTVRPSYRQHRHWCGSEYIPGPLSREPRPIRLWMVIAAVVIGVFVWAAVR